MVLPQRSTTFLGETVPTPPSLADEAILDFLLKFCVRLRDISPGPSCHIFLLAHRNVLTLAWLAQMRVVVLAFLVVPGLDERLLRIVSAYMHFLEVVLCGDVAVNRKPGRCNQGWFRCMPHLGGWP